MKTVYNSRKRNRKMKREFAYGLFGFGLAASIASLIVYLKQQIKKEQKKDSQEDGTKESK